MERRHSDRLLVVGVLLAGVAAVLSFQRSGQAPAFLFFNGGEADAMLLLGAFGEPLIDTERQDVAPCVVTFNP